MVARTKVHAGMDGAGIGDFQRRVESDFRACYLFRANIETTSAARAFSRSGWVGGVTVGTNHV